MKIDCKHFIWTILTVTILLFSVQSFGTNLKFDPTQPGFVSRELVFPNPPESHQAHASTIVQMANGNLCAAWFQGIQEKDPSVCIYTSIGTPKADGSGYTWTTPVVTGKGMRGDKKKACWNPALFLSNIPDANGKKPLILFYKVGKNTDFWHTRIKKSYDNGKTWSASIDFPDWLVGPVKNKPIQLKDGIILCGTSEEIAGQRVYYSWTKDNGKTWQECGPYCVAEIGLICRAIQPTILTLDNGALESLVRTNCDNIYKQYSYDNGKSWTKLEPTILPNPDSGIDAATIKLKDGTTEQALVYNDTMSDRGHLKISISKDGNTWYNVFVLQPETAGEYSYPAIIQDKKGLLHITYSWKKQDVMHVIVNPNDFQVINKALNI